MTIRNTVLVIALCVFLVGCGCGGGGDAPVSDPSTPSTQSPLVDSAPSFGETIADQKYMQNSVITTLTLPEAHGGNGKLTYNLYPFKPILEGLEFNSGTRMLRGTPTLSGNTDLIYQAQDENGEFVRLIFNINIGVDHMPSFTEEIADQVYIQGIPTRCPASLILPEAMGGNGELTYSLEPLPDGLRFDSATRELSGFPTILSRTSLTYTARDTDEDEAALTFNVIYRTPQTRNICSRTRQVRDAILAKIRETDNTIICNAVTELDLAGVTGLDLSYEALLTLPYTPGAEITSLQADDFDALLGLTTLDLRQKPGDPSTLLSGLGETGPLPQNLFNGLSCLRRLTLGYNSLATSDVPEDLFNGLSSLENLSLTNNIITTLPEDLFDGLSSLEVLSLGSNLIPVLPEDVFDGLSSLESLSLGSNIITTLREDVFDGLSSLEVLSLGDNMIPVLPEDVFDGLSSLEVLSLGNNMIPVLPEDVFDGLSSLESLSLGNNIITTLPEDVFNGLSSLERLSLERNMITTLPEDVFDGLSSLERLGLERNMITTLPEDVFNGLSSLRELDLGNNGLANPHEDLFDGLFSLTNLDLRSNMITTLPEDIFNGLTNLTELNLTGNTLDATPVICEQPMVTCRI